MTEASIGINLGLRNAIIGIYKINGVEIIYNEFGNNKIPLIISFQKGEILFGESAKNIINKNAKNSIYEINKLIGKNYDDPDIQILKKNVSYIIEKDSKSNKPKIIIEDNYEIKSYTPEEIYALILNQLIKITLNSIDKIKNIVLTIPTYFNDSQKKSIENACNIAGLDVKLVKESIAACIAYNNDILDEQKNILVFSMGSSELNISIVKLKNSLFKIISNSHYLFGGDDIDNELVNFCLEKFKEENGYDISNNKKQMQKLKNQCKMAKEYLSWNIMFTIEIDNLDEDDFKFNIMKADIENIYIDLFNKCISYIENAIQKSNLNKRQINEIIFTGGSTNIPSLRELIKNYFYNSNTNFSINSEEINAYGATFISNNYDKKFEDDSNSENSYIDELSNSSEKENEINDKNNTHSSISINNYYIPLSLGIDKGDGIMEVIIPRNTKIPCKNSIQFYSLKNYNSFCNIYEGERKLVKYNNLLGIISLNNFQSEQIKKLIEITFEIDNEYYLLMIIKENNINIISIKIKLNLNQNVEEIKNKINEAKENEKNDEKEIEKLLKEMDDNEEYNKLLLKLKNEIEELKKENFNLKNINLKNIEEIKNQKNRLDKYEKENTITSNELSTYKSKIKNITDEMNNYEIERKKIQTKLDNYEKEKKVLQEQLNNSIIENKNFQSQLNRANNQYNEVNNKLKTLIEKKKKIEKELESKLQLIEELKNKIPKK